MVVKDAKKLIKRYKELTKTNPRGAHKSKLLGVLSDDSKLLHYLNNYGSNSTSAVLIRACEWIIKHKTPIRCKTCNKKIQLAFTRWGSAYMGLKSYCNSACAANDPNKKQEKKETCLKRYGGVAPACSKSVQLKAIKTNRKKYGTDYPTQHPEVIKTRQKNNMIKYGYKETGSVPEFIAKTENTMLERYGVKRALQNKELKAKARQTFLLRYEGGIANPIIQQRMHETSVHNNGIDYPRKRAIKRAKNVAIRLGYDPTYITNVSQIPEIYQRALATMAFSRKKIKYQGKVFRVLGYEHYALDFLFKKKGYMAKDVEVGKKVPVFTYKLKDKFHKYYPDFYIPKDNLIIEVKSVYTFYKDYYKNKAKRRACIKEGYNFKFMIMTVKGKYVKVTNAKNHIDKRKRISLKKASKKAIPR